MHDKKSALIRSSGSDSERSPAVDLEAVLVSLSDSERSLAIGDAVLVSFVSHKYTGLEITLTTPDNLVQISSGSIGASLSKDNSINLYTALSPWNRVVP